MSPLRSALLISGLFGLLRLSACGVLDFVDERAVDYRFLHRGPTVPSDQVVIVAIDDTSVDEVGRWPWRRSVQAELVDAITAGRPAVVGFDIVQSESSAPFDPASVVDQLSNLDSDLRERVAAILREAPTDDAQLAKALSRSGVSILGYFVDFNIRAVGPLASRLETYSMVKQAAGAIPQTVPVGLRAVVNQPEFAKAAIGQAYFNFLPDKGDGVRRRMPMVIRVGQFDAVPLALAVARQYAGNPTLAISYATYGVSEVRLGERSIPVGEDGQLMLNFRGRGGTFEQVSAADLMAGRVDPEQLRDRIVLVGVTATAVGDVRVTPFDGVFPGVELHATAVDNILRADFLQRPKWLVLWEVAGIVLLGCGLGFALRFLRGVGAAAVTIALGIGYLILSQWFFESRGMVLTVIYPLLTISVVYGVVSVQHYLTEERERRKTRRALEVYLSPSMAELLSEHPDKLELGGDEREMSVLFSDIRDFTRISESMEPSDLVEFINAYLGEMTSAVFASDGMLDKYIGDAVMAVWGAPLITKDHARRAVATALEMVARLQQLNDDRSERGWPEIRIGIGINTGKMVFGNVGSAEHMSLTVVGDEVNSGSRLEGLTKMYGVGIIISESTLLQVSESTLSQVSESPLSQVSDSTLSHVAERIETRELDLVRVKGKDRPVRIFEVLTPGVRSQAYLASYAAGLSAYRQREWGLAHQHFFSALDQAPGDPACAIMIERCTAFSADDPGPEWDGAVALSSK